MSHKNAVSASSDAHPPVGTLIDGDSLKLVEVLGVGGYGVVYRAVETHASIPKSYAVKCLVSQSHQSARQRQVHIREIALHQLASPHPGVITLHRVVEDNNRTYIVMDYAPDHDLFTQILHSCRYLGDDALIKHVFLQLLDAVEYCHTLGIYHRDLKPENVLCFDDGLRVAITDFGLATTDKLSEEFRTGSVYHMSPECQGGEFAPTGNYSPMFNDIWSLGIILLNLATGRNPWKSATPDDPTFRAYLRDPLRFLPTVLPISQEINDILVQMLEVDWRERITLHELRNQIEDMQTFYSDGVVFEGSMARCPWESGMDIDSDSSDDTKENSPSSNLEEPGFVSHWSKDSTSDIVFARNDFSSSPADNSPCGRPWTMYSSSGATRAVESPSSSFNWLERSATPLSLESSGPASLPVTPNNVDLIFGGKVTIPPHHGLTIDTTFSPPPQSRWYESSASMGTSRSASTSMMQTAVEYDPYSSSFFFSSALSESKASVAMPMPMTFGDSLNDQKMMSPSVWVSSATEMSSPSIYSSGSSNDAGNGRVTFTRSGTPSPDGTVWPEFRPQMQSLDFSEQSQPSLSLYGIMTDIIPSSRPTISTSSIFTSLQSQKPSAALDSSSSASSARSKASSLFNSIKLFSRPSSPSPPSTSAIATPSSGRHPPRTNGEQYPPNKSGQATHTSPLWTSAAQEPQQQRHQHRTAPIQIPITPRHRPFCPQRNHHHHLHHWLMPGKLFAYAGAQ